MPPPAVRAVLFEIVDAVAVTAPAADTPPPLLATLSRTVVRVNDTGPVVYTPPPLPAEEELTETNASVSVTVGASMPAPLAVAVFDEIAPLLMTTGPFERIAPPSPTIEPCCNVMGDPTTALSIVTVAVE